MNDEPSDFEEALAALQESMRKVGFSSNPMLLKHKDGTLSYWGRPWWVPEPSPN